MGGACADRAVRAGLGLLFGGRPLLLEYVCRAAIRGPGDAHAAASDEVVVASAMLKAAIVAATGEADPEIPLGSLHET